MSGAKAWNSKDVAEFKKAFGARNNFRLPLISEPPYDPAGGSMRALAMLRKRQGAAKQTLAQVIAQNPPRPGVPSHSILTGLQAVDASLTARTTEGSKRGAREHINTVTARMVALTDEWVAFEARCISANNDMAEGGTDAGVREKLARRAAGLDATLSGYRTAQDAPDLRALEARVGALVAESAAKGATIANLATFAKNIAECTNLVRDAGKSLSQSLEAEMDPVTTLMPQDALDKWIEIQELQLKQLYGIEANTTPILGMQPGLFPYKDLLEVLAMVPLDHSMTKALTKVTREYTSMGEGGDYNEGTKTIRINPVVEWASILDWLPAKKLPGIGDGGVYKDPATGANMRMNAWKATALHEIGHAVDAAYGIMAKHQGKAGCGTWTQHAPADFFPQYPTFVQALRNSGVADATFVDNIGDARLKAAFGAYALGIKTVDQARTAFADTWRACHFDTDSVPFNERSSATYDPIGRLGKALDAMFPSPREAGDAAALRATFLATGTNAADLALLTRGDPRALVPDEFWRQFNEIATTPQILVQPLKRWMQVANTAFGRAIGDLRDADVNAKVARWTAATVAALPPAVDARTLAPFRAGAEPWNRDITGEEINGIQAAQEAYPGDGLWWRYSATDRGGTFVSSYQWRAPGEWFAELYAVSWFKKVEPPAATGKDVRPYLFGGSITPDAAS